MIAMYQLQRVLFLLVMLHSSTLEAATTEFLPEGRQCACVGDRLIYNCSVVGGTATLWRGTVLDCPLSVGSEITLRHSQFASNEALRICNNGDIVGRSIGVVNGCYMSQLSVTVRENLNNKTVQCAFTSSEGMRTIGESLLSVASVTNLHPPPNNLFLVDVQPGTLVFNWTSANSNCSTLQYNITTTSECGACPTVTNTTTATCSGIQLTTDAVLCHIRISSHTCNLVGNPSLPTTVSLKVPNAPQVEVIPSYSNDSRALEKLFIVRTMNQTEDHFYISGNISGSPTRYTAHTFNPVSGLSFNSTVGLSSCEEGSGCPIEVPHSVHCSQSAIINVTISAANKLGEGPRSSSFMIECTNNFVQVVYKETSTESTISCVFLNESDASEKTCCITYRLCTDQTDLIDNTQECNNNIKLEVLDHSSPSKKYCYTVTAGNDTYTIKVEGTFTLGDNQGGSRNAAAIAVGVVVSIIALLLLGIGVIVIIVIVSLRVKNKSSQQSRHEALTLLQISPQNLLKQYLTPYHLPEKLRLHVVDKDRELREYVGKVLNVLNGFRRGHTYYEFTNQVENISEGKTVLLQDKKNPKKWFQLVQPEVLAGRLKLYGEGIARSSFGMKYRVFIQSFGSGSRHLPCGSHILYNHSDDQVEPDVLPLVPVCSEHFAYNVIDSEEGCTVKEFCSQKGLNRRAFNMFLTVEHLPEGMKNHPPHDVILMDRESKMFTGPFARQMLGSKNGDELQHAEYNKWKQFALLEINNENVLLKNGSEVLHQDPMYRSGKYAVLEVDQDSHCVRLSKFIETKLNCQYEDGKAFYEVTKNEEDLLYCKKVLRPQNELHGSGEDMKLESLIEYFYAIPGVPCKAVKSEQLRLDHHRIFIQSTSQGSRCLKKGMQILYLKEYINDVGKTNPRDEQSSKSEVGSTATAEF